MTDPQPATMPLFHVYGTYYLPGSRSANRFSELVPAANLQAAVNQVQDRFPGSHWSFLGADYRGEQSVLFEEETQS